MLVGQTSIIGMVRVIKVVGYVMHGTLLYKMLVFISHAYYKCLSFFL